MSFVYDGPCSPSFQITYPPTTHPEKNIDKAKFTAAADDDDPCPAQTQLSFKLHSRTLHTHPQARAAAAAAHSAYA